MIVRAIYKLRKKPVPYYAEFPLWLLVWKPVRKFINVVIIPNIPFSRMRTVGYRLIGFNVGQNVFIGMKCYLDDIDPKRTIIEDQVTVSYGCYFALHGKGQQRGTIRLGKGCYIGMRCNILSGSGGTSIGEGAIVGAGSLVNKSIPPHSVAVGVPAKVVRATVVAGKDV